MDKKRPAYLFRRYFDKVATEEEKEELMTWAGRDENADEVKILMDKTWKEFGETKKVFTPDESEEMLRTILQKETDRPISLEPSSKVKYFSWRRVAVAATILALIATAGYFFFIPGKINTEAEVALQKENDVEPGGNKAILTLANGKTIVLDSSVNGTLARQGNSKVSKVNNGIVKYSLQHAVSNRQLPVGSRQQSSVSSRQLAAGSNQDNITYNKLSTPRGGQYQLILPDGSKVWLNAASSITFPTAFSGKERRVKITGEAYFEIKTDPAKPFIVYFSFPEDGGREGAVQVLGTRFNINAYSNESSVKTTLIEGIVKLTLPSSNGEGQGVRLKPGQQAAIKRNPDKIFLSEANIEEAIAWKNGLFYFEGEDLATIMHKISRWYDVSVTYQGNIPEGHYSGIISRNTNLSEVLEILKLSGIQFKIEGRELIVSN